jgi:hypothetical protein
MGQIADTLRATLRDLAQSDGRLYRGLQQELTDSTPEPTQAVAYLEGDVPASRQELEAMSIKALWELCKAKGLKGLSSGPKSRQVYALLSCPGGPPLRGSLPAKAQGSARAGSALEARAPHQRPDLVAVEQRLDRLERLVLLIALEVGVPQEAIKALQEPGVLPPS